MEEDCIGGQGPHRTVVPEKKKKYLILWLEDFCFIGWQKYKICFHGNVTVGLFRIKGRFPLACIWYIWKFRKKLIEFDKHYRTENLNRK
jgi:hypothetical protein